MDERDSIDVELMLKVKADDTAAFHMLFQHYVRPVMHYVDRYFHNQAISEEVTQDVFFQLYRGRKNYEPKAKFTTYLFTIATRTSLNYLRKHKRTQAERSAKLNLLKDNENPAADEVLQAKQLEKRLEQTLAMLPERQRAALLLVRYAGQSYADAASILGMSQSSVKSAIFRAVNSLKESMDRYEKAERFES